MFSIEVAEHAGTCYGVERALELAHKASASADSASVHTLGPLIHNPIVVKELAESGVSSVESLDDIDGGTVVVRAHGVVPEVIAHARKIGLDVVDATCPYVKKVHLAAERLASNGYQVLVVGEPGHPEVEGIMGHAGPSACVVSTVDDLSSLHISKKVGVVVQTTQTEENLASIVGELSRHVSELKVMNTICKATSERQAAAEALATRSDCMIVVGGKNSGNTRRLAQICRNVCPRTHHIETASELDSTWFNGAKRVGVTAGASTPQSHIDSVIYALNNFE